MGALVGFSLVCRGDEGVNWLTFGSIGMSFLALISVNYSKIITVCIFVSILDYSWILVPFSSHVGSDISCAVPFDTPFYSQCPDP